MCFQYAEEFQDPKTERLIHPECCEQVCANMDMLREKEQITLNKDL